MPYLNDDDKSFFKEKGYLIKRGILTREQIEAAQDALWEGIEARRDEARTWIGAGPRVPVGAEHPAIRATLHESPAAAMMEELVGRKQLHFGPRGPGPHLVYPSGDDQWSPPRQGHLDGYYTPTNGVPEGTVGYMTINLTLYLEDIVHRGGGFTLWPGSHLKAAEYFRTHSLLSLQGGSSRRLFDLGPGLEFTGAPGDLCLWHGQLFHTGSKNCARNIRMALIGRYAHRDADDIRFETPDDMWEYWEGID